MNKLPNNLRPVLNKTPDKKEKVKCLMKNKFRAISIFKHLCMKCRIQQMRIVKSGNTKAIQNSFSKLCLDCKSMAEKKWGH